MDKALYETLTTALIETAWKAGQAEMKVYREDIVVETKSDSSPVTVADKAAEEIILSSLAVIAPDIPIVSEEAASDGYIPETGDIFFLVDPLDGTKEFIRKSDEFTVNIALIENNEPVFGLVYAPALAEIYLTTGPEEVGLATLDPDQPVPALSQMQFTPLKTNKAADDGIYAVASKSHMTVETSDYLDNYTVKGLKSIGSSLKFCLLAKGEADLYPRFGPTMEWDTAAGHAVLKAAGGCVLNVDGTPFQYGKKETGYLNPFFIAKGYRQD